MIYARIDKDESYAVFLASEFNPATTTLTDTNQKKVVLVVDTAVWYHYYNGTWYPQNDPLA